MAALAWLLIPLFAAIGAGLWGSWVSRHRTTAGDGSELAGYARFRAAMESPTRAAEHPGRREPSAPTDAPTVR